MHRAVRKFVIFAVMAVLAFGNGLSFASAATIVHHHGSHDGSASHQTTAAHSHSESVGQSVVDVAAASERCIGADCNDRDHSNHPCCHTHVHCCASIVSLPFITFAANRIAGKGSLLVAARAPLPLGAISYPLLRPPRTSV